MTALPVSPCVTIWVASFTDPRLAEMLPAVPIEPAGPIEPAAPIAAAPKSDCAAGCSARLELSTPAPGSSIGVLPAGPIEPAGAVLAAGAVARGAGLFEGRA